MPPNIVDCLASGVPFGWSGELGRRMDDGLTIPPLSDNSRLAATERVVTGLVRARLTG